MQESPERLNDDGAEEDEEGGEDQGQQEGHHFPPRTKVANLQTAQRGRGCCDIPKNDFRIPLSGSKEQNPKQPQIKKLSYQ